MEFSTRWLFSCSSDAGAQTHDEGFVWQTSTLGQLEETVMNLYTSSRRHNKEVCSESAFSVSMGVKGQEAPF